MRVSNVDPVLQRRIDAISPIAAVVEVDGTIVAVNQAWRAFARKNGLRDEAHGVGTNYLGTCEALEARDTEGPAVALGLRRILRGSAETFRKAYACHGPGRASWYQVELASLRHRGQGGALVTHVPVDEAAMRREVADAERKHIARELHDSTAQNLTVAVLDLEALVKARIAAGGARDARLEEALSLCQRSLGEVRSLSYELAPPGFEAGKLVDSLKRLAQTFARRTGIAVMMCAAAMAGDDDLTTEKSEALYRTVEESLYNVRRHAHGGHVTLRVRRGDDGMTVEVADDGIGIAPDSRPGVGMTDMRDRIESVGGRLEITTAGARGTVVRAVVPSGGHGDALDRHRR